ncbi:MAG TPA: methyltransferase domain-containing protein [Candidatus Dormibacteraeota bacterium]|nr:methyltransferase domain-containing protein [Candidatus Dormibacteraeota bacterium]
MKSKDLFPAIFSRHAAAYQRRLDGIMARGESLGRERAIELAGVEPGMKVIDLACGPGNLTRRLAALAGPDGEVVGVDLAPGMIELARASAMENTRFEVMDIERLAFPDAFFDVAVCGHGIQFAPDLGQALHEARRVLKGTGRFTASVPVTGVRESVWVLLDGVIDRLLPPAPKAVDQAATRATVADAVALREAALAAGFASAQVELVEETVTWASAAQLVSMFTSWWDCASRLEGLDVERREAFSQEALETLRATFPGSITTTGRNHVLLAVAGAS